MSRSKYDIPRQCKLKAALLVRRSHIVLGSKSYQDSGLLGLIGDVIQDGSCRVSWLVRIDFDKSVESMTLVFANYCEILIILLLCRRLINSLTAF